MLNDRSSILSHLETRRSGKPRELVGPGPSPEELKRIITIAVRVPDHGKLHPWRFVTVGDDQRVRMQIAFVDASSRHIEPARSKVIGDLGDGREGK